MSPLPGAPRGNAPPRGRRATPARQLRHALAALLLAALTLVGGAPAAAGAVPSLQALAAPSPGHASPPSGVPSPVTAPSPFGVPPSSGYPPAAQVRAQPADRTPRGGHAREVRPPRVGGTATTALAGAGTAALSAAAHPSAAPPASPRDTRGSPPASSDPCEPFVPASVPGVSSVPSVPFVSPDPVPPAVPVPASPAPAPVSASPVPASLAPASASLAPASASLVPAGARGGAEPGRPVAGTGTGAVPVGAWTEAASAPTGWWSGASAPVPRAGADRPHVPQPVPPPAPGILAPRPFDLPVPHALTGGANGATLLVHGRVRAALPGVRGPPGVTAGQPALHRSCSTDPSYRLR
ncbi:hypothetical protein GA0115241_102685 [Streptomyces sp. DpondAA-D4]|nr:hypothetical protein GA0115241_102685 [Streptomyces sp. DpondAA-D4]